MARKSTKKQPEAPKIDLGAEIFASLRELEKEKGIPVEYMVERMKQGMANAYRKDREDRRDVPADNVVVNLSEEGLSMHVVKTVVEELEDVALEIHIDTARRYNPDLKVGDTVAIPVDFQKFGRIAAQTFKQVLIQGIREAERGVMYESYSSKAQELLTGTVLRIDPQSGDMFVRIGSGNEASDAVLRSGEQIPGETYKEGDLIRVYVLEVHKANRGPLVHVSRTHPNLVRRLFELETPEIAEVRWRSGTSPVKPVPAPRWPSVPCWRASIPWVPVSVPGAAVSALSWRSSTARRSTSWSGPRIPASMFRQPSPLPM